MNKSSSNLPRVFLSLGTNVGQRLQNLSKAVEKLDRSDAVRVVAQSSIYETEPKYVTDQPDFLNQCLEIETDLKPFELLEFVRQIENDMGRSRQKAYGPRVIDLDILLYGDRRIRQRQLSIPHPQMTERRFVLEPLAEIAPEFRHPESDKAISELADECADPAAVTRYSGEKTLSPTSQSTLK